MGWGLFGDIHTSSCSLTLQLLEQSQDTCLEPSMTWSITLSQLPLTELIRTYC